MNEELADSVGRGHPTAQSGKLVSIVICTFNRAELLRSAVASILKHSCVGCDPEVIVVDNNSTDNTEAVVKEFGRKIRYVKEPNQGLSHARNRGLAEANGRFIGFIDDDCKVAAGWLAKAVDIAQRNEADVFGGPFQPFYLDEKPKWYKDQYGSFGYRDASPARVLRNDEYVYGGNMFVRRELLEAIGGFNVSLGMKGGELGYWEEIEMQDRIRKRKPAAVSFYCSELFVYHLVRQEKMRVTWRFAQAAALARKARQGPMNPRAKLENKGRVLARMVRLCMHLGYGFALGAVLRDRNRYPFVENYAYEHISELYYRLMKNWNVLVS